MYVYLCQMSWYVLLYFVVFDLVSIWYLFSLFLTLYSMYLCILYVSPLYINMFHDMVLVSFSKSGLDQMLGICHSYAMKWRFEYNINKCAVVIAHGNNSVGERLFSMGRQQIKQVDKYIHLGITCDQYLSTGLLVQEACRKLRGTFLAICNSGVHPRNINPLTSKTIYKSVVIPKALYGCELWSNLTVKDIEKLERSHRFCLKYMQQLSQHTNNRYTLSVINIDSLETYIYYRKLQFLGQLCRLSPQYQALV